MRIRLILVIVAGSALLLSGCAFAGDRQADGTDQPSTSSTTSPRRADHAGSDRITTGTGDVTSPGVSVPSPDDPAPASSGSGSPSSVQGGDPSSAATPPSGSAAPPLAGPPVRLPGQPLDPCAALGDFQQTGVNALRASSDHPDELISAIRVFVNALNALLDSLNPAQRDQVQPAAARVLALGSTIDTMTPQALIAEWNGMLTTASDAWTGALGSLQRVCPTMISPGTTNQAKIFRLGGKLPVDFSQ